MTIQEPEQRVTIAPEVVIDKLFSLDTPLAIADMLRGCGIKGERRNGTQCPIANWLEYVCPMRDQHGQWEVGTAAIKLIIDGDEFAPLTFETSEAVTHFVRYFDGQDEAGGEHHPGFSDLVATDWSNYVDDEAGFGD